MLCPHCGTENPDTSTICSNCSESLSDSSDSPDSTDGANDIDSTDGTDSPDSETKRDEDKDSGSEVEPGNSDKPNEQTDSSTAVPDDPRVFSPHIKILLTFKAKLTATKRPENSNSPMVATIPILWL